MFEVEVWMDEEWRFRGSYEDEEEAITDMEKLAKKTGLSYRVVTDGKHGEDKVIAQS